MTTQATTTHTPGPWVVVGSKIQTRGKDHERVTIAKVDGGAFFREKVTTANAALIAAAPEMLEALRAWVDSTSASEQTGSMRPVYKAARAAIRKADDME